MSNKRQAIVGSIVGAALFAASAVVFAGCRVLPPGHAPDGDLVLIPVADPNDGSEFSPIEAQTVFVTDLVACALEKVDGDLVFELHGNPASAQAAADLSRAFRAASGAEIRSGAPYRLESVMTPVSGASGLTRWNVSLRRVSDGGVLYSKSLRVKSSLVR